MDLRKVEKGESIVAAAGRELEEETGLRTEAGDLVQAHGLEIIRLID